MNIVLLGSNGFVGSAIVRKCAQQNGAPINVRALVRRMPSHKQPHINYYEGDLFNIPAELWFDEPFVIVHFATKQRDLDNTGFYTNNVEGTAHFLQAMHGQCLGVVYGSSMSVYGDGAQKKITEASPLKPFTPLAKSRLETENLITSTMKEAQGWAFCLRPRFILGNGDKFTIQGMTKLARQGLKIGTGKQRFSIIDVDDYAHIILNLCQFINNTKGAPKQLALNIGYNEGLSLNDWIGHIAKRKELQWPKKTIPYHSVIPKLLSYVPSKKLKSMATQLGLVGADHTGDTTKLSTFIAQDEIQKPLLEVIDNALNTWDTELNKLNHQP